VCRPLAALRHGRDFIGFAVTAAEALSPRHRFSAAPGHPAGEARQEARQRARPEARPKLYSEAMMRRGASMSLLTPRTSSGGWSVSSRDTLST
jgi:hypothetical protein